ncbi:hypothetical protein WJX73_002451 [Symbiochloris irregularis]|uniref:Uncharacterized protein n=1 Tax=Symbiochloris irregularis TaxID=706552 RepID=A0AAW1PU52_9CHLO
MDSDGVQTAGLASPPRSKNQRQRLPVISLISANVEADALVQAFETVAGRSAMVGFFVALAAELLTPHNQGLFGGLDNSTTSLFCANAFVLICGSALLASASKRKLGKKLHTAVLTTLVAMGHDQRQNSKGAAGVGEAIDRVFDRVLGSTLADYQLLDMDDFI